MQPASAGLPLWRFENLIKSLKSLCQDILEEIAKLLQN
jgi:hypothetical protein